MDFKALARKYNDISLIKRIVAGLAVGTVLGIAFPSAEAVGLLGTLFVSALKAVAPVLVFFLVTSALANAKAAGSMRTVVVLYLVSTFAAALVAVGASYLFPTDLTLAAPAEAQGTPSGIGEVLGTLVSNMVANPVDALANANYLGILVWAVVLGIALRAASGTVKDVFASVSDAVSTVVRWVIALAPFGVLGSCTPPCRRTGWTSSPNTGGSCSCSWAAWCSSPSLRTRSSCSPACARTPTPSCCGA